MVHKSCRRNRIFHRSNLPLLRYGRYNFLWLFGKSPGFVEIKTPPTYAASEIYSADSVLIGRFYKENRTPVKYEEVNPAFWNASSALKMSVSTAIME